MIFTWSFLSFYDIPGLAKYGFLCYGIIQEESQKLTKFLLKNLILKTNFPAKIRNIHKIEKKNSISISVFGYEDKETHPIYVSKKFVKKNMLIYY